MDGRVRAWPSVATMGIGPAMVVLTFVYIVAAGALASRLGLGILLLQHWWVRALGWTLLAAAAAVYVPTITRVRRAAEEGRLVTDGLFGHVRNPIYALFVFFVCPAVALIAANWPEVVTPLVAYLTYRSLVPREEARLRARFGQAYEEYRRHVPGLVPRLTAHR